MKKQFTFILLLVSSITFGQQKQQTTPKVEKTILPILLYDPFTGLGYGGLGNINFLLGDSATTRYSNAQVIAMRTTKNQIMLQTNHQLFTQNEKFLIQGKWMYLDWPENTYALGGNTAYNKQELITYKAIEIDERFLMKIKKNKTFVGLNYRLYSCWGLKALKTNADDFFNTSAVGKPSYVASGVGFSFVHDSRDNVQNAYSGNFIELVLNPYLKQLGSTQNWTNIRFDARKYVAIKKSRKILANRLLVEYATGNVPYMVLPMPGRYNITRGYVQGRFRGNGLISAETELRYPIYKWLGAVNFINAHSISNPDNNFNKINLAFGGGIRIMLKKSQRTNLRIDYAKGNSNNSGLYFQITEVF